MVVVRVCVPVENLCSVDDANTDAKVDARLHCLNLATEGADVVHLISFNEEFSEISTKKEGVVDNGPRNRSVEHEFAWVWYDPLAYTSRHNRPTASQRSTRARSMGEKNHLTVLLM